MEATGEFENNFEVEIDDIIVKRTPPGPLGDPDGMYDEPDEPEEEP